jgi:hypothetical protein
MPGEDIVEKNLKRLEQLSPDQLTYAMIIELTGLSSGTVARLDSKPDFARKNKNDIAALIVENRPILEKWPDVSDLEEVLHLGTYVYRYWYRSERIRERIGAIKMLGKLIFDPRWFEKVKKEAHKYHKWVTEDKAIEIIGDESLKYKLAHAIPYMEPAGKGTHKLYPEEEVLKLRDELSKTKGLITTNELADLLKIDGDVIRNNIPYVMKHPVSKSLLYDPKAFEQNKDAVFVTCARLPKVIRRLEQEYDLGVSLFNKIQNLITRRIIPSESYNSLTFLPKDSQDMLKNVYSHLHLLQEKRYCLVDLETAKIFVGMDVQNLIYKYGIEFLLSSDNEINLELSSEKSSGRFSFIPRVPYLRWTKETVRMLASPTIYSLAYHIDLLKKEREKIIDAYWTGRLGNSIKEGVGPYRPKAFTFEEIENSVDNLISGKKTDLELIDNLRSAIGYRIGIYDKPPFGRLPHILEHFGDLGGLKSVFGYLTFITGYTRTEKPLSTIKELMYNLKLRNKRL